MAAPIVSAAWAQSSGPIQTVPWGAKQRSRSGPAEQKQMDGQDVVQQTGAPKPLTGAPEKPTGEPKR